MLLQIPVDSFTGLKALRAVYVDKTGYLIELLNSFGPYFLSRPRRFGKSLLLDTIQQIFEGKKELFSGLKIESLAHDFSLKPLPVIRINMNTIDVEPDDFQTGLIDRLMTFADSYEVQISQTKVANAISDLIIKISMKYSTSEKESDKRITIGEKNVVLLIDEYDFPLLNHLRDPVKIERIRKILYGFYSSIKGCSNFLRFVFITGITKFKQLSLFSAMNNIVDLTFEKGFSEICGFTKDEITSSFRKYLEEAISSQVEEGILAPNSTVDDLMSMITEWYDGYSWDGKTRVFNPFSIKCFLHHHSLGNFWYDSGKSLFSDVLDSSDGNRFSVFGKSISLEEPLEIQDTANINNEAFLLQAGYLTVENIEKIRGNITYRLKIPNNEVRNAINNELSAKFQEFVTKLQFINDKANPSMEFTSMKDKLLSTLWSRDVDKSEMLLSSIFSGIPKEWYRGGGEGSYKLMLLTILRFGGAVFAGNMLEALGEAYSDSGRADLLFDVSGNGYVIIETKFAHSEEEHKNRNSRHSQHDEPSSSVTPGHPADGREPADLTGLTRLLEHGKVTDKVKRILESKVKEAFRQILINNYAKPYLVSEKPILAAAIAVYGTSTVMVRFAEAVWNADGKNVRILTDIPQAGSQNPSHIP
ncbi:MAG: AAA family ATPase [Deltaproteobacteria bacterium]|jgi:hypothetical protein|nr:AAA family ATPase [Deltaproteobacteria bacterium]